MPVLAAESLYIRVASRNLLEDGHLQLEAGECVALVGPSGTGKTSLLSTIAGITAPLSGRITVEGTDLTTLVERARASLRLRRIGLIFQFGELLPELTVRENVELPSRLIGGTAADARARAHRWLEELGMAGKGDARPHQLSGGEIQRVGIARALAHEPALVLADEPTGMLDTSNTDKVVSVLFERARAQGTAVLLATHDNRVASAADRVLSLTDGRLLAC